MIIFAAAMKKIISYILLILLGTTVLSSCSMEMFDDESNMADGGRWKEVIITGLVTDAYIESINLIFRSIEPNPCPRGQWILRLLNF